MYLTLLNPKWRKGTRSSINYTLSTFLHPQVTQVHHFRALLILPMQASLWRYWKIPRMSWKLQDIKMLILQRHCQKAEGWSKAFLQNNELSLDSPSRCFKALGGNELWTDGPKELRETTKAAYNKPPVKLLRAQIRLESTANPQSHQHTSISYCDCNPRRSLCHAWPCWGLW